MGKKIGLFIGAAVLLCAGGIIGCYICCCCKGKIAVVDIQAVVAKSAQVQTLKVEMENKTQELTKWLVDAQNAVKSEKDEAKQQELLQKYNEEFAQKREAVSKEYNAKLQAVDKDINETIINAAKEKGYKIVITKGVVIYGGNDITEEINKVVK